jgi:hypothetical protein
MIIRIVFYPLLLAALAFGVHSTWGKDISFDDLPGPAKRVAQTELNSGKLQRVEKVDYKGHTIYALDLQRADGSTKNVYLNADGTYVRDQDVATSRGTGSSGANAASGQNVQLGQVPEPVRRTIQTETRNGPVSRIVQLPQQATNTMYEVFFRQPSGQEKVIYLNPDGSYVKEGQGAPGTRPSWAILGNGSTGSLQPLSAPSQVTFSQLPTAVQTTLRNQAGASRIQNIQSGQLNGQPVYQAEINRNGQHVQLQVNQQGSLLGSSQAQSSFIKPQP